MANLVPVDFDPFASGSNTQQVDPYAKSISNIESGGRYDIIGPATRDGDRAIGKYQVMGKNVGPWTKEALGQELTPEQFASSPEAQEAVFKHKFGSYVSKYGPEGAARAWFAGEGGMNDMGRKDVLGTSVADYASKFNRGVQANGGVAVSAQSRGPQLVPVDHDPFAAQPQGQPQQAEPKDPRASTKLYVGSDNFNDRFTGEPAAPKRDPGYVESAGRGALQGASFGFDDELRGASAAALAGLPEPIKQVINTLPGNLPAKTVAGIARLLYESYQGEPGDATKAYDLTVANERKDLANAREQYPVTTTLGEVGGAIAMPVGGLLGGATLPVRMGRGAGVGAVSGALYGAGQGESLEGRAAGAAIGGVGGALIGGLAPPIIEGGVAAARAIASNPINAVRSAINPEGAAQRAVGRAYQESVRTDPTAINRLAPQELTPGGPAVVMDTLGNEGRNLARASANTSGAARDTLNRTLDARYTGQAARVSDWFRGLVNFGDAHSVEQALTDAARRVNRPNYAQAMNSREAQSVWDGTLEAIAQAPVVQDAIRGASRTGANRAAADGFQPIRNPFVFDANGAMTVRPGITPNLSFWDAVKRNLDDVINKLDRAGERSASADARTLRTQLVGHLDNVVPTYQNARAGAAAFFQAENALEAGQNFVAQNFALPQVRQQIARMSPVERQLFQDGFISRYIETLDNIPDRADVVRRIYNSRAAQDKINAVLGPARAVELEAILRVENVMQQNLRAVQGNSTTAQQLIAAGLGGFAGTGGGLLLGHDPGSSLMYGVASALTVAGRGYINQRVAQRVAELLTSRDPAALQRGINMLARSQSLMNALRAADGAAAKIGGQQVPKSGFALQATGVSRAENDQPEIPRPVGK